MVVLKLVPRRANADTQAVLSAVMSKDIAGDVAGVTLTYRGRDGTEKTVYTGVYWDRPAEALRAAMRVSLLLAEVEDDPQRSA